MQIIDTRELPEEENIWLAKPDNRLDQTGARKIISELNSLAQGIAPETVAAITEMEIEKVREIAGLGNVDMAAMALQTPGRGV
jgi:hypothetical protein